MHKQEMAVLEQPFDYSLANVVECTKGFGLVTMLSTTDFQRAKSAALDLQMLKCSSLGSDTVLLTKSLLGISGNKLWFKNYLHR
jgi:hypothetical protein